MAAFSAEEYKNELAITFGIEQLGQKLFLDPKKDQGFVFISYSHKDYKLVYRDLADLRERGVPFWFDEGLPAGENWDDVVRKKIAEPNCAGVIFYLSDNLFLSDSIQTEIKIVRGKDDHPDAPNHPLPYFSVNLTSDAPRDILLRVAGRKEFVGVDDESAATNEWFSTLSVAFPNKSTYLPFSHARHKDRLIEEINAKFRIRQHPTPGESFRGNLLANMPRPDQQSLYDYVCSIPCAVSSSDGLFAQLRYDTCSAVFCGRKQELSLLNDFLKDTSTLSWWAITGAAGCGKTRLAYEFSKEVNKRPGWCSRFINWPVHQCTLVSSAFTAKPTDKNLLLVFDYVYAYQTEIAKWIEQLQQKYVTTQKIRVLLIEREDKKVDASGKYIAAPWEDMFCSAPHYPTLMKQLKYRENNINLNHFRLTKTDGFDIVQSYCDNTGRYMRPSQIQYIVQTVFVSGRRNITPLSLLLLTENHLSSHSSPEIGNPLAHALESIVERNMQILNNTLGINNTNDRLIFKRIMHISTILGKVKTTDPLLISYASENSGNEKYWAIIDTLTNSPVYELGMDECFFITAIQPDLIGEYYAFTRFRTMSDARLKELLDAIHSKYPAELGRFLIRYIEDGKTYSFDSDRLSFYRKYLPANANTFIVLDENNREVTCEVLFTFDNEESGKSYIVYTDHSSDEDGSIRVFASIYDSNGHSHQLLPINTEREWQVIEVILETLQESITEDSNFDTEQISKLVDDKLNKVF